MLDSRAAFIKTWNKLTERYNKLIETFTLTKAEYEEFQLTVMKLNELLNDDAYFFGFTDLKKGTLI